MVNFYFYFWQSKNVKLDVIAYWRLTVSFKSKGNKSCEDFNFLFFWDNNLIYFWLFPLLCRFSEWFFIANVFSCLIFVWFFMRFWGLFKYFSEWSMVLSFESLNFYVFEWPGCWLWLWIDVEKRRKKMQKFKNWFGFSKCDPKVYERCKK